MNTIWIVIPILTLLMFDLGLTLRFEDFGRVFLHPWPVAVALFGQLVLLPLIALALAWLFHLPPVFFIGLVLIACCPGGSSSNVFSKLANGDVALSVTLTALILLAVIISSLLSRLVRNSPAQRRTVVIEVGMQIYSLIMNIVLLAYVGLTRVKKARP